MSAVGKRLDRRHTFGRPVVIPAGHPGSEADRGQLTSPPPRDLFEHSGSHEVRELSCRGPGEAGDLSDLTPTGSPGGPRRGWKEEP